MAGSRGLTREAYALDLRQFTSLCRARSLVLFTVRRTDVEGFARDLETKGRARATVTRRCTIAGFTSTPRRKELLDHSPAAHVRRPRETTSADIEHLGMERGHRTLTIHPQGRHGRDRPLAPRTARAIDLAIGERTDGPVFLAADRHRPDRHGAGRMVRRVARRAGIAKTITPHTLRHVFITAALDRRRLRRRRCPVTAHTG